MFVAIVASRGLFLNFSVDGSPNLWKKDSFEQTFTSAYTKHSEEHKYCNQSILISNRIRSVVWVFRRALATAESVIDREFEFVHWYLRITNTMHGAVAAKHSTCLLSMKAHALNNTCLYANDVAHGGLTTSTRCSYRGSEHLLRYSCVARLMGSTPKQKTKCSYHVSCGQWRICS